MKLYIRLFHEKHDNNIVFGFFSVTIVGLNRYRLKLKYSKVYVSFDQDMVF